MTDEPDDELEMEFVPECEVVLHDGQCWVLDPAYLHPDSEAEGVLALQYTVEAGLWYLDGESRQWVQVGAKGKPALKTVQ